MDVGLFMRPRRPLLRVAAGATTAAVAFGAGKRSAQQNAINEKAEAAQMRSAPASAAPSSASDPTAELGRLAQLHESGALTDAEFAAAKAKLLGI